MYQIFIQPNNPWYASKQSEYTVSTLKSLKESIWVERTFDEEIMFGNPLHSNSRLISTSQLDKFLKFTIFPYAIKNVN